MVSHSLTASDSLVIINQQKAIIEEFVESMIAKEFTIDNYHKYFGCNDELEFSLHKYYCQLQKINEDSCMNSFWNYNTGAIVPEESRVLFFLHNEYFQNCLDYKIKFVYSFPGWNLYELRY